MEETERWVWSYGTKVHEQDDQEGEGEEAHTKSWRAIVHAAQKELKEVAACTALHCAVQQFVGSCES